MPYRRDPVTRLPPSSLKAIHPLGKSPVICDGALVVECCAIIEYRRGAATPAGAAPRLQFHRLCPLPALTARP
jgi:glutathione S-transferase